MARIRECAHCAAITRGVGGTATSVQAEMARGYGLLQGARTCKIIYIYDTCTMPSFWRKGCEVGAACARLLASVFRFGSTCLDLKGCGHFSLLYNLSENEVEEKYYNIAQLTFFFPERNGRSYDDQLRNKKITGTNKLLWSDRTNNTQLVAKKRTTKNKDRRQAKTTTNVLA